MIYPLHVFLDGLSALTKKIKLSVNVWTPELNVVIEDDSKINILEEFLQNDPEIVLKEQQSSFRCHGKFFSFKFFAHKSLLILSTLGSLSASQFSLYISHSVIHLVVMRIKGFIR